MAIYRLMMEAQNHKSLSECYYPVAAFVYLVWVYVRSNVSAWFCVFLSLCMCVCLRVSLSVIRFLRLGLIWALKKARDCDYIYDMSE